MGGHLAEKEEGNPPATEDLVDPRPDAARKRLRECKSQRDACEAIREIVSNLLGCEEIALFQLEPKTRLLSLIWSFGIQPAASNLPKLFSGSASAQVIAGEPYIDEHCGSAEIGGQGEGAIAFIPIQVQGKTFGVLALLRLLPQKTRIDEQDLGLFAVLSKEAGKPLFGGTLKGRARRERNR
jgi:chemotaxis protein CheD